MTISWQLMWSSIDVIHRTSTRSYRRDASLQSRALYGKAIGVEIPAWVLFHAILGYFLLASGLMAILLRIPLKSIQRQRWLHPYFGLTWVLGTIYMPITAIWCVYSFPGWDIIAFFIFSMYLTISVGYICIRIWQYKARLVVDQSASLSTTSNHAEPKGWPRLWKYAHGTLMIYSFVMLLGAGVSFPLRALDDYKSGASHP